MAQGQQNPQYAYVPTVKAVNIYNGDQGASDEGSFYLATNATPGTAIATTTSVVDDAATQSSTHAQASPVMLIQNQWSPSDPLQKCIYLRYLKMTISQVPTSATSWKYAMRLDPLSTKLTTAGTVITPVNVNSNSGTLSKAYINFGAITTVIASVQSRLVGNGQVNAAVPVTLDTWFFTFGNSAPVMDQLSGGTNAKNISIPCSPIIIAPGYFFTLEMWGASNAAAPSWEFEMGYIERPMGQ